MQKIIFLIGRDNWQKDDNLNHILIQNLKKTKHEIRWEDPAGSLLYKLRSFENKYNWLPNYVKKINTRILQLSYGLFNWNYFKYLSYRRNSSIELRTQCLKKSILQLGNKKEIIVLSRSAGGRLASYIVDELKINYLICLSYPFKHPNKAANSTRYMHLLNLKTPMLIIQADKDEYGGIEVKKKYTLSLQIELFFVNANHDFILTKNDWERVIIKLHEIIN